MTTFLEILSGQNSTAQPLEPTTLLDIRHDLKPPVFIPITQPICQLEIAAETLLRAFVTCLNLY